MITPMRIFVLIFNAHTENEGIHTVKVGDRNKILMFESEDDALRFALMLEAQDFPTPTVEEIDAEEIKTFCESANYEWEIIPENSDLVIPPEINLEETDWQIDAENEDTDEDAFDSEQVPRAEETELSDSELENIRRKLEGLL
ncbi:DUF3110 domain-containing protein [Nostoc sp. FACHB-152]|uniref:DUF3110 domain-containing protein n=1 Tax=unclassified Nostoc TaxID=2593658 RepID=UPI001687CD0D|nr:MULTISPECIES: DUF3110 domain-containing protein [unclassified Nostoc]MBD2447177.1 DUF3110 domain-containing protein [Nostoc sp. FACHB-152]MBD2469145.1 DUF3110 domain-containing protein [Nostoc sp. FACHB-145]